MWRKERLRKRRRIQLTPIAGKEGLIDLTFEHSEKLTTEEARITALKIEHLERLTTKERDEKIKRTCDAASSPAQTSKNQILSQQKPAQSFDFRKIGVRQSRSGRWVSFLSRCDF